MDQEQPDWDTPLTFSLTAESIITSLFSSAEEVHTGRDTCVNASFVLTDTTAVDPRTGNHCRLAEQEFTYDEQPDITWHDWAVELRIGEFYILAHWRVQLNESPAMWMWCGTEAENAFVNGCVLIGQRVRRGLVVEADATHVPVPPRSKHH